MSPIALNGKGKIVKEEKSLLPSIQVTWNDLSGITRARLVTSCMMKEVFAHRGLSLTSAILSLPNFIDHPFNEPVGEVKLKPDLDSIRIAPWRKDSQIVFGNFEQNGLRFPLCPRSLFHKTIEELEENGLYFVMGFELEFLLVNKSDNSPIDDSLYCSTKSLIGTNGDALFQIIQTLELLGIPIWQYHSESCPGQYEISVGPYDSKTTFGKIGDDMLLCKETIFNIVDKFGMKASFIPKPYETQTGSGLHVHISLRDKTNHVNLFQSNEEKGKCFIGGILKHLTAILPIIAPTGNSFDRLKPESWAGAFICVGTENKEAPIRLIKDDNGVIERFEIKTGDGSSNPYLMLASYMGAGIDGMKNKVQMPEEVNVDPNLFKETLEPIPSSLYDSLRIFEKSEFITQFLGSELKDLLLKIRQAENDYYEQLSNEDRFKFILNKY